MKEHRRASEGSPELEAGLPTQVPAYVSRWVLGRVFRYGDRGPDQLIAVLRRLVEAIARGVPENPLRPFGVVRRLVAGYAHVPCAQQMIMSLSVV